MSLSRIATFVMSFIIGAVFGTAGTIGFSAGADLLHLGLILAFVGCLAILVSLRILAEDRWAAIAGGVGMYLAVFVFSMRGPGGSVVVPDTGLSQVWLIGVGVIILIVAAWPDLRRVRPASAPAGERTPSR
ncbi:MAG: DUF6113 family protein [Microbacterium sp.]|nr:DUF6113 family protein [Microbacterium sp.]